MKSSFGILSLCLLLAAPASFAQSAKRGKKSPPPPCTLSDVGFVENEVKAIVINKGQRPVVGANRLEEAVSLLDEMRRQGVCTPQNQNCELSGEGVVAGAWESHRILVDGLAVAGGKDLGSVMTKLSALRDVGTCNF